MIKNNRDKLLGVAAIIALVIASANALEYFLAGKRYLDIQKGLIEKYEHTTYGERTLYSKTNIRLAGNNKEFFLTERTSEGGYIEAKEGDSVTLYTRKWYQLFYNYSFRSNIYYVEKNGIEVYDNLSQWKAPAFFYMCVAGGCALFLLIMYLDQVKNISISNWFQKRFLNKPKRGVK